MVSFGSLKFQNTKSHECAYIRWKIRPDGECGTNNKTGQIIVKPKNTFVGRLGILKQSVACREIVKTYSTSSTVITSIARAVRTIRPAVCCVRPCSRYTQKHIIAISICNYSLKSSTIFKSHRISIST